MITIHKTDTGAVIPWEYMAAQAGTYKAGQGLHINEGLLAPAHTNTEGKCYLCMADITVTAGEAIPVTRFQKDAVYEGWCNFEDDAIVVGDTIGFEVTGMVMTRLGRPVFEVTEIVEMTDGIDGGIVRVRFIG